MLARYGGAIAVVALAWVIRTWLSAAIGPTALPFVTFYAAVAAAAWYGGLGPAILAVALSTLAANYSFTEPLDSLRIADPLEFLARPLTAAFIVVVIDQMHRARRQVGRTADILGTTLTSIGDGVVVTDAEGRVTFLNREAERLTGWTSGEAAGRPLTEVFRIVHERTRRPAENPVEQVLREGVVVGLANHTVLIARDGRETAIDDSAAPVRRAGESTVFGVVLVFRDVAAPRRAAQAQARLAALVETSGDAILSKDLDGTILTWNAAAERLFGYPAGEIVGRSIMLLVPEERAAEERQLLERLRQGEETDRLQTVRVARDGRLVRVALTNSAMRDREGEVVGASTIFHDLTEILAAQEALARERELLATTLSSIGDAVIATDAGGRVSFLNPVASQLTGWSAQEAAGRPLTEVFRIVNEQTREPVANPALRAMEEGTIVGLANHTVLISKDGEERPVDDSAAPIRDERQAVVGSVLVFRDVTHRRRAERAMGESEQRTRSVVDNVVDGIVTIDERGRIESFNRAAERLFGRRASEVIGTNVSTLMPEPYRDEHDGYLRNYLTSGVAKIIGIGREVVGLRKDGSTFPMELAVSEFPLDGRRYFTGIVRDITERRSLEDELRGRVEQLALMNRRKGEFLATLSHELRNPLAPIRNSVALLQLKGPSDPELVAAQDVIDRQVGHMSRLLDDLLDVNRLDRHKLELRKQAVSLAEVVEIAVETARPVIAEGHHQLTVDLPPEPVVLDADPMRLAQVFANLLNNAAKYMDPGGCVALRASREGMQVILSVEDNGIGLDAATAAGLFEIFAQAPAASRRGQGGLGIGLALSKGLVELHGGALTVRSDGPGKGSVFSVRLPVSAAAATPARPTSSHPGPSATRRRVLITDDVRDNADTLAAMLRALGHETHVSYDGESAVRAAETLRPELVLLDIGLPGIDGYEACRRIRGQSWGREMVIVAQTGWGQDADRQRAAMAGFDRHLVKPLDLTVLQALLAERPLSSRSADG